MIKSWRNPQRWFTRNISVRIEEATQQRKFLEEYKIRTKLEQPIIHYASKPLPKFSMQKLYDQSKKLSNEFILQNARETIEHLLIFNARRLKEFRKLPYLVVLNPSISQSYNIYLQSMSQLLKASSYIPHNLEENTKFSRQVLDEFIEIHADTLPSLSKGFTEVGNLLSLNQIKSFLDHHLKERICMRLIAYQHIELTKSLNDQKKFVPGGKFNGVIKMLYIPDVIKKNAEIVNDITMMKYDQSVPIKIDTSLLPMNYWSQAEPELNQTEKDVLNFPYIEYHLDYILMELFKNSFRAQIENKVTDPVVITVSTSLEKSKYLQLRIRDKGKGIPQRIVQNIFDYSFTTYESGEGDSYKTLNVPPGLGGNSVAGMGFGLPLAKQYIEVFNDTIKPREEHYYEEGEEEKEDYQVTKGSLTVQTYNGWGTDIYLKTIGY